MRTHNASRTTATTRALVNGQHPAFSLFTRLSLLLALGVGGLGLTGCAEFDTTRVESSNATLGAEVFEVLCLRVAADENPTDVSASESRPVCKGQISAETVNTPKLRAIAELRPSMVDALDRMLTDALAPDLEDALVKLLPFYEPADPKFPENSRALAEFLGNLAEDDAALEALERLANREGYKPLPLALGVVRPALSYPDFDAFAVRGLEALNPGGVAHKQWTDLLRAVALEAATFKVDEVPEGEESTLELARELLFKSDPTFGSGLPTWAVFRDERGLADIALEGNQLPEGFADMDQDGLADVDERDRFIAENGTLLSLPAPFRVAGEQGMVRDEQGRAIRNDGSTLYRYLNADDTLVAGMARELAPMFEVDQPIILDLTSAIPPLLGRELPCTNGTDCLTDTVEGVTLQYAGRDTATSSLLDMTHALTDLMPRPATRRALTVFERFVMDYPSEAAGVLDAVAQIDNLMAGATGELVDNAVLADDMMDIVVRIARQPGLMEALMRAFADPRASRLGVIFAEMMTYRDVPKLKPRDAEGWYRQADWLVDNAANPSGADCDGDGRPDAGFCQPVNRKQPDNAGNQSALYQTLAVINDLNGVRFCNKDGAKLKLKLLGRDINWPLIGGGYKECELFEIPDVAEFTALSIIGEAEIEIKPGFLNAMTGIARFLGINSLSTDTVLQEGTKIEGMTSRPTPQALSRMVLGETNEFMDLMQGPLPTKDGVWIGDRHPGAVFLWEREYEFNDGLQPSKVSFFDVIAPIVKAFDEYDNRSTGFLFNEMMRALYGHYASPASSFTQSQDPNAPFYAQQSDAVSYEPFLAEVLGNVDLMRRLHQATRALAEIRVSPGVDGIDVLVAATQEMVNPAYNVGYAHRDGSTESFINDGSRTVQATPLYGVIDAIRDMSDVLDAEPDRKDRFNRARRAMLAQLFTATGSPDEYQFVDSRINTIAGTLLAFGGERWDVHQQRGDLNEWSRDITKDLEEQIQSPLISAGVNFLDAVHADPAARDEVSAIANYLVDEASDFDAFDVTLVSMVDSLQWLEDERNLRPLLRAVAETIAPNVREVLDNGLDASALNIEAGSVYKSLDLFEAMYGADDKRAFQRLFANAVSLGPGTEETPLETLIDAATEIHRVSPGAGDKLSIEDYRAILLSVRETILDEDHGLERLYSIINNRTLDRSRAYEASQAP